MYYKLARFKNNSTFCNVDKLNVFLFCRVPKVNNGTDLVVKKKDG